MRVTDIINECKIISSEYTKHFLDKEIRSKFCSDIPETYNIIWIRNYCMSFIMDVYEHLDDYENIYAHLGDDDSQEVFREIFIKRFLIIIAMDNSYPFQHYPTQEKFEYLLRKIDELYLVKKNQETGKTDEFVWNEYSLKSETKNIAAFELNQYSYKNVVKVTTNMVVLDCGASQGEEVIYFSSIASGLSFHSFALDREEIERYVENMVRNRITDYNINQKAVWDRSDEYVSYIEDGSRSSVNSFGEKKIRTISLDDYVNDFQLTGPFFIKMDIEGAETNALKGCSTILSLPNTQAAISVYHKPNDIRIIGTALLKYRKVLYLKQCKSNISETMMYIGNEGIGVTNNT